MGWVQGEDGRRGRESKGGEAKEGERRGYK